VAVAGARERMAGPAERVEPAGLRLVRGGAGELPAAELEALRARDPAAIARALRELLPRIDGWMLRLLGSRPDLEDAVQDALVELTRALPRFEGRSQLSTLAHTVTVRVAYRYYGRRARQAETSLELVPPPADLVDPESRAASREALRRLYRCLEKLPKKQRTAFVLCAVEGMQPAEAAQVAGIGALSMRSNLFHARRQIARMLGADPVVAALLGREDR
jgi:RNA polymerase sigma-70 factor, ECF subfamily